MTANDDARLIELDRVSKHYSEGGRVRTVLHDVSATFGRGEFVVLVGKSGSGKSTLLNLVSGIDAPDSGDVRIAGRSLVRLDERGRTLFRRSAIGFIFQFFNLLPTLTVFENLWLPLELLGRTSPGDRSAALDLLAHVGLADRRDTMPDRLSGGEQQRVAIARALARRPDVLFCDEPTGALDSATGRTVLRALQEANRSMGASVMIVTHAAATAAMANRVIEFSDGRIRSVTVNDAPVSADMIQW